MFSIELKGEFVARRRSSLSWLVTPLYVLGISHCPKPCFVARRTSSLSNDVPSFLSSSSDVETTVPLEGMRGKDIGGEGKKGFNGENSKAGVEGSSKKRFQ